MKIQVKDIYGILQDRIKEITLEEIYNVWFKNIHKYPRYSLKEIAERYFSIYTILETKEFKNFVRVFKNYNYKVL